MVCLSVPEFCLVNISVKRVFPNECYFFLPNLLQSYQGRFILNSAFIILTTTYLQYHNVVKIKVRNRYVCPPPYSAVDILQYNANNKVCHTALIRSCFSLTIHIGTYKPSWMFFFSFSGVIIKPFCFRLSQLTWIGILCVIILYRIQYTDGLFVCKCVAGDRIFQ